SFPSNGRKTNKHIGLLTNLSKNTRFCILSDIMGHGEGSKSTRSFCMHTTFWNYLTIKMSHFLQKPKILHQHWTSWASSLYVLIIRHGCTCSSSKFLLVFVVFHIAI